MIKVKFLYRQACRQVQRMRNILAILALFVCTSICLGQGQTIIVTDRDNMWEEEYTGYYDRAGNGNKGNYGIFKGNNRGGTFPENYLHICEDPRNNRLIINSNAKVGNVYGAIMSVGFGEVRSMTNNEVIVNGGNFHDGYIAGAFADDTIDGNMNVSSNTVRIMGGSNIMYVLGGRANNGTVSSSTVRITGGIDIKNIVTGSVVNVGTVSSNTVTITGGRVGGDVFGGFVVDNDGTAIGNTVNLTDVFVKEDVYGARIGIRFEFVDWLRKTCYASSNTVTITSGAAQNVYGGYIQQNGTATENKVNLTSVPVSGDVFGARIGKDGLASSNTVTIKGGIIGVMLPKGRVYGGCIVNNGTATGNTVNLTSVTVTNDVFGARIGKDGLASSNTVTITSGTARFVNGGYIEEKGTATLNTVNLTNVNVSIVVYGAKVGKYGYASSNTVTIERGEIKGYVYGGYIGEKGTATGNKVNLTSVTVRQNVFGARIGKDGYASSNTVTITSGTVDLNVYGGYVSTGTAIGNTVTINGGTIRGNVFGGYVSGNGKAIYNTITITGTEQSFPEFSTATILCGGICANAATNDAFTGNTLNIETKGVVVKGISNFEKYEFHLKDIKSGEVILTATSGGCSWNTVNNDYTPACAVDLLRSNIIYLRTQGILNKDDYYTLIKSPQGFEDNVVETEQFEFENEGLLVKYYWDIKIADNRQDLIAKLIDKKIRDEGVAKSLLEGYGAGVVCTNNGMDCIISKMEETESLLGERKGEIGAFCGLAANKSSYNEGSHIDMTEMSMMGGVGIRVEVGAKELSFKELSFKEQSPKEQSSKEFSSKKLSLKELISELSFKELSFELTVGVFGEYGTGNSDIDSGLCPCEKKSEGKSKYVGGGLLGRYSICEDEFSETKLYGEAILRAGRVGNSFNSKEAKDSTGKEYEYDDEPVMYGGCALGVGYKYKASEKIDLDCSLRYMFGYQDGRDVERVDADGNKVKFESVKSNRIGAGVIGKYVELEKVKPYAGIGCEYELSGKVKGAIQNGADRVSGDIPAPSFGGWTGIMEAGASGKVWKLSVDISGQGYLGVRKGFGGMLKIKYAFGKDAHAKPQPKNEKKETTEKEKAVK